MDAPRMSKGAQDQKYEVGVDGSPKKGQPETMGLQKIEELIKHQSGEGEGAVCGPRESDATKTSHEGVKILRTGPIISCASRLASASAETIQESPPMRIQHLPSFAFLLLFVSTLTCDAAAPGLQGLAFRDPTPKVHDFSARASEIDARAKPHPEIQFDFTKDGKPTDTEHASVDTRVAPRGQLVVWLMGYNAALFERLNSYGLHAIQVSYANGWFSKLNKEPAPADEQYLGNIRLEATSGVNASEAVDIPVPDSMQERAFEFVKWLAKKNPEARWDYFLTPDGKGLDWEKVIVSGASHGATSSARFAIHQKVARCVMLCGPRDQYESWQGLPSATPKNRFFGYSHTLDGGWSADHYPRSWLLLGLNQFGPIVNTDEAKAPFGHSRRLITSADVKGDDKKAHSYVTPNAKNSPRDASGNYVQDEVWRYLYTSPVDEVGHAVPPETVTRMNLRTK